MLGPRRLFPDLLGYETAPGGTGTLDLLGGGVRVQDATGLADGARGIGLNGPNSDLWDDAGAYSGQSNPTTIASIGGFGSGMGKPFRTPLNAQAVSQAQGMARPPPAPASPPAMNRGPQTAGAPQTPQTPMQTRGFAHPAQPVLSGAPPATPRPQVGGTKGWLNAPAFDGNAPMSRMQVLSQMLMGAGAAAGQAPGGGNWLGAGLQGAGQAMMGARQYESQRQRQAQEDEYRKLTMELQRKKLEQKTAPQTHVVGGALVDDTGREIYKGERTEKIATTAEAALLANAKTPEERATIARQLIEQKSAMDPGEAQRLAVDRERLNLERQRVEISRRQGSRAAAEPLMAVQTPEGPRYVPRSQAAGRAPADTREGAGPTQEANLRKEYNQLPEVKGFKAVLPAYRSAIQSASRNDRVSDLDLVFAVGKALDPDSVVREGEQVMIANSQGLPDWVQGAIGAVSGGARIQPETRQNLMRLLKSRASAWRQSASARRDEYAGYATGYGLDPGRSVPGLEELPDFPDSASVPAAAVPPPAPGQPDPYADMFGLGG